MKKLGKLLLALALFSGLTGLASCKRTDYSDAELEKIEITSQADKVEFFAGEELDTAGLEVTAFYSDGTKKEVENWSATGFDSTILGEQTITVTYTEEDVTKTTSYKVTVKAVTLDKIEITTKPAKTEYYVGDTLDTTDLVVTATYNNGKTEDVTAKAEITGFDSTAAAANQKITVTYEGKTAQFTVKITAVAVAKLEITAQPTITEYYIGDNFDKAGLVVTATYNNGKTEDVTEKAEFTGFDSRYATEKLTVTAAYGGKTATFTVKILSIELASIKVTKEPAKKVYYLKDSFDATGLEVTAYYNNGTNKVLKENEYATNFNSSTAAESKTVEVTHHGQKAQFTVKIIGEKEIKVTKDATNTKVYQYQNADYTGLEISMVYEDGAQKVINSADYTLSCDTTKTGSNTVTVTYGEKTVTYAVTMVAVDTIIVSTLPTKVDYYWDTDTDASFDFAGLVISRKYTDNKTEVLPATEYTVTGFDITNRQQQAITVNYKGKTTTFNVTVHDISSIVVTNGPAKIDYYWDTDTALDSIGLVVTEKYDDNTTKPLAASDYSLTGFDITNRQEQSITVTYQGKTADFNVTVHDISTIVVTTPPTKTEYYIDETLDKSALVVTETYDDGTTKTINNDVLTVTGFNSSVLAENQIVTIAYNGKTATFSVSIVFNWYETPEQLSAGTSGTYGTEGTYVNFGVWPQDVVSVDEVTTLGLETSTDKEIRGYMEFVKGNDGNYYVKCNEERCDMSYTYTKDGSAVGTGIRWFKVMPIKWRVVDTEYDVDGTNGNSTAKLLVAENILTANVQYYESTSSRTINDSTVYANNYMHSQIRAYLNGYKYTGYDTTSSSNVEKTQWNTKGFLQTAFTSEAIDKIITTKVDNAKEQMSYDGTNGMKEEYACGPTDDKIFLLSEKEVVQYSKEAYNSSDNSRIRVTTDFAKANYAQQSETDGFSGYWWLRSPSCSYSIDARGVIYDGNASEYVSVYYTYYGVVPALSISF